MSAVTYIAMGIVGQWLGVLIASIITRQWGFLLADSATSIGVLLLVGVDSTPSPRARIMKHLAVVIIAIVAAVLFTLFYD